MRKITTWLTCGVLILGNTFGGAAFAADNQTEPIFTDVPATYWAYQTIQDLAQVGLWKGVGNQQFAPNRPMTHREYAILLERLLPKPIQLPAPERADSYLTRMEMAQWLYAAIDNSVTSLRAVEQDYQPFSDEGLLTAEQAKIGHTLEALRLILGDDQHRFNPEQYATRAETAVFSQRIAEFLSNLTENHGAFYTATNQGDQLCVRLYWGEKPTLGYSIKITQTRRSADKIDVYYTTTAPAPGTLVGQMVTYPQAEVLIPAAATTTIREIKLNPAT